MKLACVLLLGMGLVSFAALGPNDNLPHEFAPYDLAKLNWLGLNYCENLLDSRINVTSYTHLGYDASSRDAWHLQFPDDAARLLEGIAWEDEYSPVVRLELARRLVKGIMRAHIPGTKDYYSFRNRSGGKTFLVLGQNDPHKGRLTLSNWGDTLEGSLQVGFRVQARGTWHTTEEFAFSDDPTDAGNPGIARSERSWHESPYVFQRTFKREEVEVAFRGKYWLSDEDKPLEYAFSTASGGPLQIILGEPGKPMPLLGDPASPTYIHLPDRKQVRVDGAGATNIFARPEFSYLIIRRPAAWACPGYSAALLVMWQQRPDEIEILPANGCGEVRLSFSPKEGVAQGRVWLYPFSWVNDADMRHIHQSAEHFLAKGTLRQNGYPSQQLVNAIPAGLAAGAYLLAKYKDPLARTAAIRAEGAADAVLQPFSEGKSFIRSFFPARAAGWMLRLGEEKRDRRLIEKYSGQLERWMKLMTGPTLAYDGRGWANGWDHFNCLKTAWLAYVATGDSSYLRMYERALAVYTIDEKGIYRDGKPMAAPGGFETYAGAMPMGAWGHAGKLDFVDKLINLNVPNGWIHPEISVKDLWNDAGAGPWAQDDANPEFVGFSLRGLELPRAKKRVVPVGAFPAYDREGTVSVTGKAIVRNPYFRPSRDPVLILPRDLSKVSRKTASLELVPGSRAEQKCVESFNGTLGGKVRSCAGEQQLQYKLDLSGARGAALDFRLKGDGYRIDVSPDGKRWLTSYESWSDAFADKSMDVSYLTGSAEELVKLVTIVPPSDTSYVADVGGSQVQREHYRYLQRGSWLIYRLDLFGVKECHIDLLAGNAYQLEGSPDGRIWKPLLAAAEIDRIKTPDAGWFWSTDATACLSKAGKLYLRFSDRNDGSVYEARGAFLRRLTVYGSLKSRQAWVRLSNTEPGGQFSLEQVVCRTWK